MIALDKVDARTNQNIFVVLPHPWLQSVKLLQNIGDTRGFSYVQAEIGNAGNVSKLSIKVNVYLHSLSV